MVATFERYRAALSSHHDRQTHAVMSRQARTAAVKQLQTTKRRILAALERDLPELDTAGSVDSNVPEDAIAQARDLEQRVDAHTRDTGDAAYVQSLLAPLGAAIATAEAAARSCYGAETLAQHARDELRDLAHRLDSKLIAFRSILRSVIGPAHGDYRKLRSASSRQPTDKDAEPTAVDVSALTDAHDSSNDNAIAAVEAAAHTATGTG